MITANYVGKNIADLELLGILITLFLVLLEEIEKAHCDSKINNLNSSISRLKKKK